MIGLYTALFGDYDTPRPTPYNGVLFTDHQVTIDGWHVEIVKPPHKSLGYSSRYYFTQSCLVMPNYEYTVMHGANATLRISPNDLVSVLPNDIDLACCLHHHRNNVYDEAKSVIRFGKDKKTIVRKQISKYRQEGFSGKDLSATILLIRRNTPALKELEAMWWDEVKNHSIRDQLSFDYCRWKLNFPIHYLPGRWTDYLDLNKHRNGKNYNDQKI